MLYDIHPNSGVPIYGYSEGIRCQIFLREKDLTPLI
jgi:hypothetical protein